MSTPGALVRTPMSNASVLFTLCSRAEYLCVLYTKPVGKA